MRIFESICGEFIIKKNQKLATILICAEFVLHHVQLRIIATFARKI